MKILSSRHSLKVLTVVVAGIAFAWLLFAVQASRRAADNAQRQSEQHARDLSGEWIEGEIDRLASGKTTHVHFYSSSDTDSLVNRLAGMSEIRSLTFWTTDLSDTGVKTIAILPNLEKLTIHGGSTSDAGIELLSSNQSLKKLHLVNLDLTDKAIVPLQSMQNLEYLTIYCSQPSKCRLTDKAVNELMKLSHLKKLNLGGGWLPSSAHSKLKAALPECQFAHNFADDEW